MKRLGDLAEHVSAQLIGDAEVQISDAKSMLCATSGHITFVLSDQHLTEFLNCECPAAIVSKHLNPTEFEIPTGKHFLVVEDAETSFGAIIKLFRPASTRNRIGISERACVSDSAQIAEDVDVFPGAFIGDRVKIGCGSVIHPNVSLLENTIIGANTVIYPNAVVYENCVIGDRCIIHAGAVIGAFGFGYRSGKSHQLSPQLGNVVLGNDVEIGSNTTVDRGTYDSTTIGDGSKLDNQVMIGHNCQIGRHNMLCSQVGIAGSCTTGDYVVMAGQVGIGDHLNIGDKVSLAAQSGVMHDLDGGQTYIGAPAIRARDQMQIYAVYARLPEMRKQLRQIQREIENRSESTVPNSEAA